MPRLKSANFAVTELASGITNAATRFQVVDASLFPNEGPFIVLVHDSTPGFAGVREIMEVGSINKGTNTFSDVLRGREGTSPVAHSAGARVECVWTAGTHGELADKVELDNLAGIGRTTETVKGNADNLSSHMAEDVTKADVVQTAEVNDSAKVPSAAVTYGLDQKFSAASFLRLTNPAHIKYIGSITNINDLDNCRQTGIYQLEIPGSYARIYVFAGASNNVLQIRSYDYISKVDMRHFYDNNWSNWVTLIP